MNLTEFRVLIIDDVAIPRAILKKMLLRFGVLKRNIFELSSASSAIKEIMDKNINLVISDWSMPDMEGIDLLKQVRADSRIATLPFILTTAYSDKDKVAAALEAGVTDFLLKPFGYETLKTKLLKILENNI